MAPFLAVMDVFALNLALPSIQDSLHSSNAGLQAVVAGYSLSFAALLITAGRLGDIHGRCRVFAIGVSAFAVTSGLGAIAPDTGVLVACRVLQGAAAALMYPQVLGLIQSGFADQHRAVALSSFAVIQGLATVAAQLVAGLVVQTNLAGLGWRPILLMNVPIGLVAAILAVRLVPESKPERAQGLDTFGVLLVVVCLGCLVTPLLVGAGMGWPTWLWLGYAVAIRAGSLFVRHERRLARIGGSPLLALDLFRSRLFVAGMVLTILFYAGQQSSWFTLTLYLQHGLRLTPLTAGLVVTPLAVSFVGAALLSPLILRRLKRHTVTLGLATLAAAAAALSLRTPAGFSFDLLADLALSGIGFGLVIAPLIGIVMRTVPSADAGAASGLMVTTQRVSGALGVAIVGQLFFGSLVHGYAVAFSDALHFQVLTYAGAGVLAFVLNRRL